MFFVNFYINFINKGNNQQTYNLSLIKNYRLSNKKKASFKKKIYK